MNRSLNIQINQHWGGTVQNAVNASVYLDLRVEIDLVTWFEVENIIEVLTDSIKGELKASNAA